MKRLFFAFLVIVISSTAQAKYSGGSGTTEDPYQIANASDLLALAAYTNDYDANFIMTADINLSSYIFTTAVIACDINNSNYGNFDGVAFAGTFDGAGHKVINIKIDTYGEGNDFLGLFGYIYLGNVKNLGVDNISIIGGNESYDLGGLAGSSDGWLNSCYSTGTVIGGDYSGLLGGLVGAGGNINNCGSTANVSGGYGSDYLGGLVGLNKGIISNCYSTGAVTGDHSSGLGGLVGLNNFASISDCYSTGAVNGGGFSYSAGGLVGYGYWEVGDISNCYSTGTVTGAQYLGGLVGSGYDTVSSYFLITSGPDNGIGIPLTDEEMKQQSSFAGWDFVETWGIEDNQTCPFLKLTYSVGDLNRDKSIDFFDLAILASHWLEGP